MSFNEITSVDSLIGGWLQVCFNRNFAAARFLYEWEFESSYNFIELIWHEGDAGRVMRLVEMSPSMGSLVFNSIMDLS
jgi:hypothetical protein